MRTLVLIFSIAATSLLAPAAFAIDNGKPAPAVTLPELQSGKPFSLSSLNGRVVLLDFWASWCGPCRESLPQYQKMRDAFRRSDFEVVAISLDIVGIRKPVLAMLRSGRLALSKQGT